MVFGIKNDIETPVKITKNNKDFKQQYPIKYNIASFVRFNVVNIIGKSIFKKKKNQSNHSKTVL